MLRLVKKILPDILITIQILLCVGQLELLCSSTRREEGPETGSHSFGEG